VRLLRERSDVCQQVIDLFGSKRKLRHLNIRVSGEPVAIEYGGQLFRRLCLMEPTEGRSGGHGARTRPADGVTAGTKLSGDLSAGNRIAVPFRKCLRCYQGHSYKNACS
jgi:hypothetical protein